MLSEHNKQRSKSSHQHKKPQKFGNDIYSCVKEREKQISIKRCSTPDLVDNYPKHLHQDKILGLSQIDQINSDSKNKNGSKTLRFRNFLTALEEHQKKVSIGNMNLLGLEVKKVSYAQKNKRSSEKNLIPFMDENNFSTARQEPNQKSCTKNQLMNQKFDNSHALRLGITFREGHEFLRASKIPRASFMKTRQKTIISSHSEKKRKTIIDCQNPIYDSRINSYKDLIFKVNLAHGVYVETQKDLHEDFCFKNQMRYKAWVGSGNNGNLIKSLLKRRFWWHIIEEKSLKVHFVWTQLKIGQFFASQNPSEMWVQNSGKYWGKSIQMEEPVKTSKLVRQKNLSKREPEQQFLHKIWTQNQVAKSKQYCKRIMNKTYRQKKQFLELTEIDSSESKMHNHLINNFYLGNKKALFYNLKQYYDLTGQNAFTKIPLTFHIKKGFQDLQYKRFIAYYKKRQALMKKQQKQWRNEDESEMEKKKMRNVWIVKPGELTNRGNGITVIDEISQLNQIIKRQSQHQNGTQKTFIVQLYIDRPFLYQKRKFDIRHYMLITHVHGLMRAYWYRQGYIRTSSYEFDIYDFEKEIHLTNDAIQKYTPLYGKYEAGNKISYAQFQRYLDNNYPKKNYSFENQILPQMKSICLDSVKSSFLKLSPQRLQHNFQIFGLDFMIDQNFKPWLIEINTNPCLEISCNLLGRIIPQAVDQALRLSLDIVFPPPCHYPNTSKHLAPEAGLQNLNYELIFDEKRDGSFLRALFKKQNDNLLEEIGNISDDEVYQDDGKDIAVDELL